MMDAESIQGLFTRAAEAQKQGRYEEAERLYRELLDADVRSVDLYANLSLTLASLRRFDEAQAYGERGLALDPGHVGALGALGGALRENGDPAGAAAQFEAILRQRGDDATSAYNLALCYRDDGRLAQARALFTALIQRHPQQMRFYFSLAECLLLERTEWTRAWKFYESRLSLSEHGTPFKALPQPIWDGTPQPEKTLLVFWEQGYGDTLMAARFLPELTGRFREVRFLVQPPLHALMARTFPDVEVLSGERVDESRRPDLFVPILSLPHLLDRPEPDGWPRASYLRADSARFDLSAEGGLRIGVCWRTDTTSVYGRAKTQTLDAWLDAGLFPENARLHAIQFGVSQSERSLLEARGIPSWETRLDDFDATVALCAHLDLVVTIDTALAHVAGALGIPTFVLLPYSPGIFWGRAGEDAPAYDALRLFRQTRPGAWDDVYGALKNAISAFAPSDRA